MKKSYTNATASHKSQSRQIDRTPSKTQDNIRTSTVSPDITLKNLETNSPYKGNFINNLRREEIRSKDKFQKSRRPKDLVEQLIGVDKHSKITSFLIFTDLFRLLKEQNEKQNC